MSRKYDLVGVDGNAFCVMGYVGKAMSREEFSSEDIEAYTEDAKSSDYSHLLCVSCEMIDKVNTKVSERV